MAAVRIGLLGLGKMGRNHLRVLSMLKTVELCFIHDLNTQEGRKLAAAAGTVFREDLESALAEVDAVVIVTATSAHYENIKLCVQQGIRHLFVEKPLVDTLERTREIVELVEREGLKLQVGFIERFNPAVMALQRVVEGSRMINLDLTRTNKLSARITDVDVVSDLMIHDIDLSLAINGPATEIDAYGVVEAGFIAFARANLRHDSGAFSSITASRITEKRIRHISATTEDMFVDCNLLAKEVIITRQSVEQYSEKFAITAIEQTIDVRLEEALLLELMMFVEFACGDCTGVPDHISAQRAFEVAVEVQQRVMQSM